MSLGHQVLQCYGQHCHQITAWSSLENSQEDLASLLVNCNDNFLNWLISSYVKEYPSHASLLNIDSHPNSESSETLTPNKIGEIGNQGLLAWTIILHQIRRPGFLCGGTNCLEEYPWTIDWPILVCLSLLAVMFAIKVLSICGTICCVRSLSRICSKVGELLIWIELYKCCLWSIWQHIWQYEHSPLQCCFVCQCTTCHLWCG